jgi:hypothetical protein
MTSALLALADISTLPTLATTVKSLAPLALFSDIFWLFFCAFASYSSTVHRLWLQYSSALSRTHSFLPFSNPFWFGYLRPLAFTQDWLGLAADRIPPRYPRLRLTTISDSVWLFSSVPRPAFVFSTLHSSRFGIPRFRWTFALRTDPATRLRQHGGFSVQRFLLYSFYLFLGRCSSLRHYFPHAFKFRNSGGLLL